MAIIKVNNLSKWVPGQTRTFQQRLKRAIDLESIPWERRTRQQQAFLDSLDDDVIEAVQASNIRPDMRSSEAQSVIDDVTSRPDTRGGRTESVSLTPLRRELEWRTIDGVPVEPINRFSADLYPGTSYPEVDLPEALTIPNQQFNTMSARFGVRQYPNVPIPNTRRGNIPRRLDTQEDRVADKFLGTRRMIEFMASVPQARIAKISPSESLAEVYSDILSKNPSTAFVPGSDNVIQRDNDVPPLLLKAGVGGSDQPTGQYGTSVITSTGNKGRSEKRQSLFSPDEVISLIDLNSTLSAQEPYRLVTQLPSRFLDPRLPRDQKAEVLASYQNQPYAEAATRPTGYMSETNLREAGLTNRLETNPGLDIFENNIFTQGELSDLVRGPVNAVGGNRVVRLIPRPEPWQQGADDVIVQLAGLGVPSRSGILQDALNRPSTLADANSTLTQRILSAIQNQRQGANNTGAQYIAQRDLQQQSRVAAEAERLAYNDRVARQEIQAERERANLGPIVSIASQSTPTVGPVKFTPEQRAAELAPFTDPYIQEIAEGSPVEIPRLFQLSEKANDRQLKPYTLVPETSTGLSQNLRILGPEVLGVQVPYGVVPIVRGNPLTTRINYQNPPLYSALIKQEGDTPVDVPSSGPALQDSAIAASIAEDSRLALQDALSEGETFVPRDLSPAKPEFVRATKVQGLTPLNVDEEAESLLAATPYGRRHFMQGDPVDVDNKLSINQKAMLAQMQRVVDQVTPLSVSRQMDPITAGQLTIDHLDQQIDRLRPLYQNATQTRNKDATIFQDSIAKLQSQKQELLSLFRDYDNLSNIRTDYADNLKNIYGLLETPEEASSVEGITAGGSEILVPLRTYLSRLRDQSATRRFGVPFSASEPRLITASDGTPLKQAQKNNFFRYGGAGNYSIMPSPEDGATYAALIKADPTFEPGELRVGVEWEEVPAPTGSRRLINVINPGTPVIDPKTGRKVKASPNQLVGYDSQVGPYSEAKMPQNAEGWRQEAKEFRQAALENFTLPRLNRNVPLKDVQAPRPTQQNVATGGQRYQRVRQDGTPIARSYTVAEQSQSDPFDDFYTRDDYGTVTRSLRTQRPQTGRFALPTEPRYIAGRKESFGFPRFQMVDDARPVAKPTQSKESVIANNWNDLSPIDSIPENDLFGLADELGIRGLELMDSRNNFGRLRSEIKSRLTAKYPERFATNSQYFVRKIPPNVYGKTTDTQLSTVGFNNTLDTLDLQDKDPNTLKFVVSSLRTDPRLQQQTFDYFNNKAVDLDKEINDIEAAINQYTSTFDRLKNIRDRSAQREASNAFKLAQGLQENLARAKTQEQIFRRNVSMIRDMLLGSDA